VRLVGPPPQAHDAGARRGDRGAVGRLLHGKSEAAKEAGVSAGVIDGLVDEGTLRRRADAAAPAPPAPDPISRRIFPASSAPRWMRCARCAANGSFHVALLDGVTGSGKTEVYFEAIAEASGAGKQSLILMPEIALTGQFLDRFAQRFGVRPAGMAFRADAAHARAHLGRDRGRRGAGRGRRALGAVPALRRSRPDRRR
jgi:primosomal protein N' (replication factor Y)